MIPHLYVEVSRLSLAVARWVFPEFELLADVFQRDRRSGESQLGFGVGGGLVARFVDSVEFVFEGLQP